MNQENRSWLPQMSLTFESGESFFLWALEIIGLLFMTHPCRIWKSQYGKRDSHLSLAYCTNIKNSKRNRENTLSLRSRRDGGDEGASWVNPKFQAQSFSSCKPSFIHLSSDVCVAVSMYVYVWAWFRVYSLQILHSV